MPSDDGGGSTEAAEFFAYVTETYPNLASHWVAYDKESDFLDIVNNDDYSRKDFDELPGFSAGLVFTSGSPEWAYTVRRLGTRGVGV